MFHHILQSIQTLTKEHKVSLQRLPQSVDELINLWSDNPPQRLQHKLMDSLQKHRQSSLFHTDSGPDKARLTAVASTKKSSAWLQLNSSSTFSLSDQALASAVCHRIGLNPIHLPRLHSGLTCACGKVLDAVHLHGCKLNVKCGVNDRHDKVKTLRCLARLCQLAGLEAEVEKSSWVADSDKPDGAEGKIVPDISVTGLGQKIEVDISIICPPSATYAKRFRKPSLTISKMRVSPKHY